MNAFESPKKVMEITCFRKLPVCLHVNWLVFTQLQGIHEFCLSLYELRAEKIIDPIFGIFKEYFVDFSSRASTGPSWRVNPLKQWEQSSCGCHLLALDFRWNLNFRIGSESEKGNYNKDLLACHLSSGRSLLVIFLELLWTRTQGHL